MAGRLLVACFLSGALAFLLLVSSGTGVEATTFRTTYGVTLTCEGPDGVPGTADDTCTCESGGASEPNQCPDMQSNFDIPATPWSPNEPDHAYFVRLNTFHAPPEWGVSRNFDIPHGAYAGLLFISSTLSLANSPCTASPSVVAPLPLYVCSTDNSPGNQIAWVGDGSNLTQDNDGDTLPDGCNKYPAHVDTLVGGLKPRLRLYGFNTLVTWGAWFAPFTQINLVVFNPEQLAGQPGATQPEADLGDSLGYSYSLVVNNFLGDPPGPPQPRVVTELCTPLAINTTLWGLSGGQGVLVPPVGDGPEISFACINWAGMNSIGVNNDPTDDGTADDGCWVVTDWCGDGIDNDGDTDVDEMCGHVMHRNPNNNVGAATSGIYGTGTHLIGVYSESQRDADGDGFPNNLDACPYIASSNVDNTYGCDGCPPGTCSSADHDGDGYYNRQDICPLVSDDQTDGDTDGIGKACDTDNGTQTPPNGDAVGDGPFLNDLARGGVCVGGTDTDGDGWCDATEDIVGHGGQVLSQSGDTASTPEYIGIDYPISADPADPGNPGAAPGTCSDQTYYATAGDPNGAGTAVDNDGDGAINGADPNCTAIPNDADQDGVADGSDNCPNTPNPEQLDIDGDTVGDACDSEDDDDGLLDSQEWGWGYDPKSACSPFDTNGDHAVNVLDMLLFKPELGGTNPKFDLNKDGSINVLDVLLFKPVLAGSKPCPYKYG